MTAYRTPLFFAQAVGRVVRARGPRESATVFLPAVRPLLALAAELENDRNYVMAPPAPAEDDPDALDLPLEPAESGGTGPIEILDSQAEFAHVLHSGRAVTASGTPGVVDPRGAESATTAVMTAEDQDFLGLPGLLTPEQTAALLATRDTDLRRRVQAASDSRSGGSLADDHDVEVSAWRAAAALRREVNQLVARVAARTGTGHAKVHSQLRRDVPGPASAAAGPDVLEARRDHLLSLL
jgi:hypothetical protein